MIAHGDEIGRTHGNNNVYRQGLRIIFGWIVIGGQECRSASASQGDDLGARTTGCFADAGSFEGELIRSGDLVRDIVGHRAVGR